MSRTVSFAGLVCVAVLGIGAQRAAAENVEIGTNRDGFAYQFIESNLNSGFFGDFLVVANTEGVDGFGDPIPAQHDLQSFLRFNVSTIPQDAIIESAILRLFAVSTRSLGFGANPDATHPITLDIFASTTDFEDPDTERSVTWPIRPSVEADASATTVQDAINVDVVFDLKELVIRWQQGLLPNFGFGIVQRDPVVNVQPTRTDFTGAAFASSVNPTAANRPVLEIQYSFAPDPEPVPEPTSVALAMFSLPALAWAARRRWLRVS